MLFIVETKKNIVEGSSAVRLAISETCFLRTQLKVGIKYLDVSRCSSPVEHEELDEEDLTSSGETPLKYSIINCLNLSKGPSAPAVKSVVETVSTVRTLVLIHDENCALVDRDLKIRLFDITPPLI
jgi:hypothetical protein